MIKSVKVYFTATDINYSLLEPGEKCHNSASAVLYTFWYSTSLWTIKVNNQTDCRKIH